MYSQRTRDSLQFCVKYETSWDSNSRCWNSIKQSYQLEGRTSKLRHLINNNWNNTIDTYLSVTMKVLIRRNLDLFAEYRTSNWITIHGNWCAWRRVGIYRKLHIVIEVLSTTGYRASSCTTFPPLSSQGMLTTQERRLGAITLPKCSFGNC